MKGKTVRVTADFSPQAYEELEEIAKQLGTTKVEAIRKALGLLKYIGEEKRKGASIIVRNNKKEKEIVTI